MDFPLANLMDQDACYRRILKALHPDGLRCPRCDGDRLGVHRRHRAPVLDYRCRDCHRVFNAYTGTALHKTSRSPAALVLILRGFARGATTARMARELGCDRMELLALRYELQANARAGSDPGPLPDPVVEADECYVNAGKKGVPHPAPDDPPRGRANKRRGHGTFDNDRPPVAATIGRGTGRACFRVVGNPDRRMLEGLVQATTAPGATLNTDEWRAYAQVPELGRGHATVDHGAGEWARDDDGDGVSEVHCDTTEGTWTGLRNYLRPSRGVSKWYLAGYAAIFEWADNIKRVTDAFLRLLLGAPWSTDPGS